MIPENKLPKGLLNKLCHTHYPKGDLEFYPKHRAIKSQGAIVAVASRNQWGIPDAYEVQWFSCLDGSETNSEIVLFEQILFEGWTFYKRSDVDKWRRKFDESIDLVNRNNAQQLAGT